MFKRRHRDRSQEETTPSCFAKLKDITTMVLKTFREFSVGNTPEETIQIQQQLDETIERLRQANTVKALESLEVELRRVLTTQQVQEQLRRALHTEVLREFNTATAKRVRQLAGDSKTFATQLHQGLKNLEQHAMEDQGEELRQRIRTEIPILYQIVEDKQRRDLEIVQDLRAQVEALERQLAKASEELVLDPLTEVYNRRALDARLQSDIRSYPRNPSEFSLLLFDIDHFKRVNDTHGHLVGDQVLKALARLARRTFRMDDFVARYGGEEFAAILYDAGTLYASRAAERFRLAVATKAFEYQREGQTYVLHISVSIGVASYRPGDTPETLLERADQALYLAKNSGRNLVKTEEDLPN